MKRVSLTHRYFAIVDDEDIDRLSKYSWSICSERKYARARVDGKVKRMHRLILNDPPYQVDHKNSNKLDNRKSNLRPATKVQNAANSSSRSGSSKFKGVSWQKSSNKWRAYIVMNNKQKHLGLFISEIEAAKAYNVAAIQAWGEYAKLNEVN